MNILRIAIIASILSGCASTMRFSSEVDGYSDSHYRISAKLIKKIDPGFFSSDVKNDVSLYINGDLALKGALHLDESGDLQGTYQSKTIKMSCGKDSIFSPTRCTILLDEKLIGDIRLKYNG